MAEVVETSEPQQNHPDYPDHGTTSFPLPLILALALAFQGIQNARQGVDVFGLGGQAEAPRWRHILQWNQLGVCLLRQGDIGGLGRGVAQDCQAGRGGLLLLLLGLIGIALLARLGRLGFSL